MKRTWLFGHTVADSSCGNTMELKLYFPHLQVAFLQRARILENCVIFPRAIPPSCGCAPLFSRIFSAPSQNLRIFVQPLLRALLSVYIMQIAHISVITGARCLMKRSWLHFFFIGYSRSERRACILIADASATVCPRSSNPFYMVSYYIKRGTTFLTYSTHRSSCSCYKIY